MKKLLAGIISLSLALTLCSCNVDLSKLELPTKLDGITMERGSAVTIDLVKELESSERSEEEIQTVLDNLELTWTSSDSSVVVADGSTITAVGAGNATIAVSAKDYSLLIPVKVIITPTGFSAPETIVLFLNGNDRERINLDFIPSDATETHVTFMSDDNGIATVDEYGNVQATGEGNGVVVVKLGQLSADVAVIVKIKATALNLTKASSTILIGETTTIEPYLTPDDAETESFSFVSCDEKIATVLDDGTVEGVGAGTTTISVRSESGFSAIYTVTVKNNAPDGAEHIVINDDTPSNLSN